MEEFEINIEDGESEEKEMAKKEEKAEEKAEDKAKKKFKTKTPLFYGRRYEAGEEIQLDEQEAKELFEGEIVEEV